MERGTLKKRIIMECPLCDKVHEVEERTRNTAITMKGEKVHYRESFYFCANSNEEECEFETGNMMNENLMAARNAYRKEHNLLTSDEIVEIRQNYGLTQVELARLLGWGEATISRYESKAIQDEAYDIMLRIIKDDPLKAIEFLDKNKDKFSGMKRMQIRTKMMERLDFYGKEFLARQALLSEYVKYTDFSDANGFKLLEIDKVERIISYFAEKVTNLYKVKLMKMLWYADALFFKKHGTSMTGLVYLHEPMGALPVGHYQMVNLKNVNVHEEEGYDSVKYHFYPNEAINNFVLTKAEIEVLNMVVEKFESYNAPEIVNYMHEETAYTKTKSHDIIPYSLAKEIREFK